MPGWKLVKMWGITPCFSTAQRRGIRHTAMVGTLTSLTALRSFPVNTKFESASELPPGMLLLTLIIGPQSRFGDKTT